ncbi:hypothetical protein FV232_04925 [Methylobacterium sp. WL30]|uniref:hypothetical protein n=1 Tax=unclassified Methylobacterium TaxID=2615210 RepID=UPI0011C9771A|nr:MULTISPECIES: hypothetical protein [unclassified Methylobacterium]TXM95179.1 hypothetical protein FV223_01835 [Methylobacterium sp. WL116]TXN41041.1 hypothetical protein FV225_04060 [Methylobacterium sp. WL93]TXN49512.1 hypothetical protein FV227_16140 [Methylobacterium sp. WL119]TXN69633.1 hypothetical protein FV232_04925 [Methylobacterium sp. WL30]
MKGLEASSYRPGNGSDECRVGAAAIDGAVGPNGSSVVHAGIGRRLGISTLIDPHEAVAAHVSIMTPDRSRARRREGCFIPSLGVGGRVESIGGNDGISRNAGD